MLPLLRPLPQHAFLMCAALAAIVCLHLPRAYAQEAWDLPRAYAQEAWDAEAARVPDDSRFEVFANPALEPASALRAPKSNGKIQSPATGLISRADENQVDLELLTYENHRRFWHIITMRGWTKLRAVRGDKVVRGAALGTAKDLAVTIMRRELGPLEFQPLRSRDGSVPASEGFAPVADVSEFFRERRRLFVPPAEHQLILIDKANYRMQVRDNGRVTTTLDVGFGQEKGRKRIQGDLKSPSGMYFVVDKKRGEFGGKWGAYYGGHWIKINYPNAYDAAWGKAEGKISSNQAKKIRRKWAKRQLTSQITRLGGGIGFHGWAGTRETRDDWSADDPHLTWGCIVLHNVDIALQFDGIRPGTMVVLF